MIEEIYENLPKDQKSFLDVNLVTLQEMINFVETYDETKVNKSAMNQFIKQLKSLTPATILIVGSILVAGTALALRGRKREQINPDPFDGQLFTVSDQFDNKVMNIVKKYKTKEQDILNHFNYNMYHMYCESGLKPQAHVNKEGKKYIFGLFDRDSIGPQTWGGGLFGLVRPFYKSYVPAGESFEDWLLSSGMHQLDGYEKWVMPAAQKGKLNGPEDYRMNGFAPAHVGADPNKIIYADNNSYEVHKYLDTNDNGKIEKFELDQRWLKGYNGAVAYAKKNGPRQIKLEA